MKPAQIVELIKAHEQSSAKERSDWDKYHRWYIGEFWEDLNEKSAAQTYGSGRQPSDEVNLETNYPFAFIDTMIANICPTNPQVTVNALVPDYREVAKNRERLANNCLRADKVHDKAWDLCSTTAICGWAFSKVVWSKGRKRPTVQLIDPRNVFWDRSTPFEETPYVIEVTPIKKSKFESRILEDGEDLETGAKSGRIYNREAAEAASGGKYPQWLVGSGDHGVGHISNKARDVFDWVIVYEVYDFESGMHYHMLEDSTEPLFASELPFELVPNPYDIVVFNRNLRDSSGISDIKLIRSPQERLNEIDTIELEHAHVSIPKAVINPALFDDPEKFMAALTNADTVGSVIEAEMTNNQVPLSAALQFTQTPTLLPSFDKMRERTTGIIEFTLGIPAYSRGRIGTADVATEVALADTSTRTRNGRRIKVLEDWVASVSKKMVGLYAEKAGTDDGPSSYPVREETTSRSFDLTAEELGFDGSDVSSWLEYEMVPYSPTENHRLVTLQKIQTFMELLLQHPGIDQEALIVRLLDLLGLSELHKPGGAAPQPQPGAPGQPPSQDNLPAGALPEGVGEAMEATLPPEARALASQPKLEL